LLANRDITIVLYIDQIYFKFFNKTDLRQPALSSTCFKHAVALLASACSCYHDPHNYHPGDPISCDNRLKGLPGNRLLLLQCYSSYYSEPL